MFENINRVIRRRKSKKDRTIQWPQEKEQKDKKQSTLYKTAKIKQHKPHLKPVVNSGALEKNLHNLLINCNGRCLGNDHMVFGYTFTYATSACNC